MRWNIRILSSLVVATLVSCPTVSAQSWGGYPYQTASQQFYSPSVSMPTSIARLPQVNSVGNGHYLNNGFPTAVTPNPPTDNSPQWQQDPSLQYGALQVGNHPGHGDHLDHPSMGQLRDEALIACDSCYGPNEGLYFVYDRLFWSISAPRHTVIGDVASEGFITTGSGITYYRDNDLNTSFIEPAFKSGDRFDFGWISGCHGWAFSVLNVTQRQSMSAFGVDFVPADPDQLMRGYADGNGDGFDDDVNGNRFHGRHGEDIGTSDGMTPPTYSAPFDGRPDTPGPTDLGDLVYWYSPFNFVHTYNVTEMFGLESLSVYRVPTSCLCDTIEWTYGVRYLQFKDTFGFTGRGGFLDTTTFRNVADNDIVGPQIGMRWAHQRDMFRVAVDARFLAGFNFQHITQNGSFAANAPSTGGQNRPVALLPQTILDSDKNTRFASIGEVRVESTYKINSCVGFRLGYTFMAMSGLARGSESVVYRMPSFGISSNGMNETVLVNAITYGLEFNR